jgi:uncharacterized integral membrane protein
MPFLFPVTQHRLNRIIDIQSGSSAMRKFTRLLTAFFLILVFLLSTSFAYFNMTPVSIAFGNWQLPAQPVFVWIIGAFVCGGTLGLLLGLRVIRDVKAQLEIRRLKKRLAAANDEVNQLRATTLKDLG